MLKSRGLIPVLFTLYAVILLPRTASAQTGVFSFAQSLYTADAAQTNASISVILSGNPLIPVSVDFATQNATATAGVDYVATNGTLFFATGTLTSSFAIQLLNPTITTQTTRSVILSLSNPSLTTVLGSPSNAVLTITNSFSQFVQFSQSAYSVTQGITNAFISVVRTGPTGTTATVFFNTSDGSAKTGTDYIAVSGTLTFTNGITTNIVAIPILPGNPLSTNQTVNLALSNPSGVSLGSPSNAVLTIIPSGPPVLQFSQAAYNFKVELGLATLTVIRFGSTVSNASVAFATSDGTAVNGVDYTGTNGTLLFSPGIDAADITFPFAKFNTFQSNKTVFVTLSNPIDATIGPQTNALVTIINDRPQTVTYTNADGSVATVRLARGGTMDISPGNPPSNIVFSGTDSTSEFSVKVKKGPSGGAVFQVGGLSGDGDLHFIKAPNLDLIGSGIQLTGFVTRIYIHDVLNGASISLGGIATNRTQFYAHNIEDGAAITSTCRIAPLRAARIGDVAITAPNLGSVTIRGDKREGLAGDFNGQIQVSGDGVPANEPALGGLHTKGAISNAIVKTVNAGSGKIIAAQIIDSSIYVGFTPANPNDPLSGGTFVPGLRLGSVNVKSPVNGFVNSVIAASRITDIKLNSVETDNSGIPFGVLGDQSILSVKSKTPPFKWNSAGATDQALGDFHVIFP
jgi:hypothetical protein